MLTSFWATVTTNGSPWIARVTGFCPKYQFKREFIPRLVTDHTYTRYKRRKLGARHYWALPDGVYDVYAPDENPWRYFIIVKNGDWGYIEKEAVIEWLKNTTSV